MTALSLVIPRTQIAADEQRDPEAATDLERSPVAEHVALLLTAYRAQHGLTQTALTKLA